MSMIKFDVSVATETLDQIIRNAATKHAQELLVERIRTTTASYVPVRTGQLRNSSHRVGNDSIVWTKEYARYVFYGTARQKANNWFEKSKAANLHQWIKYAELALRS